MNLQIFTPSDQLRSMIKCYYLSESNYSEYVQDVFFPDGCAEVVFHIGLDFYREGKKENWSKLLGQITRPLTMRAIGRGKSFGIWFYPHAFSNFSGIPMNELNDRAVPLDEIFSRDFIEFVGNCIAGNEINELLASVDRFFISRLLKTANPLKQEVVRFAVNLISQNSDADLSRLASQCNISNRYLQKIFLEKIGISPKYFCTVMRFQKALHLLSENNTGSLTSLSYQTGYYDQPHFIRDFKRFTGFAPSEFDPKNHPINQYFLNF